MGNHSACRQRDWLPYVPQRLKATSTKDARQKVKRPAWILGAALGHIAVDASQLELGELVKWHS